MKAFDFAKALGVAVATIVITMAISFPMVAFYAYVIEPGHPAEFYTEAAQWIAPWASHIFGPLVFFGCIFWLACKNPELNAMAFAAATMALYLAVDLSILPLMGFPVLDALTLTFGISFVVKTGAAFLGAYLGRSNR